MFILILYVYMSSPTTNAEHLVKTIVIAILFFSFVASLIWRGRIDKRTIVEVSEKGIWHKEWLIKEPLIWDAIREVRLQKAPKGEPFISLELHDTERTLSEPRYEGARVRAGYWRLLGCSPFTLRAANLEISNKELHAMVLHYINLNKEI